MENTKELILAVATQLFLTKGYEKTTITDILKQLDGLTKGAIYHYFDSKEDIFNEVAKNMGNQNRLIFDKIKFNDNLSGAEKIAQLVTLGINNATTQQIIGMTPRLLDNPKLLASSLEQTKEVSIPDYFYPIISEGISDGSIQAKHPQELAELLAVLLNVWLNPLIFEQTANLSSKLDLLKTLLNNFNITLDL
jgi:AcrR family transcriptional regulator